MGIILWDVSTSAKVVLVQLIKNYYKFFNAFYWCIKQFFKMIVNEIANSK